MKEDKTGKQITAALKELVDERYPGIAFVALLHNEDEECRPTTCHAMTNNIAKEEIVSILLGIMEEMGISIMEMQLQDQPVHHKLEKDGLDIDDGFITPSK